MKSVKKISILLLALIFTMSMFTSCSSKKSAKANSTNDVIKKNNSMNLSGMVTAVKGKKITIAVMPGFGMQGGPGGKQQGNAPSGAPKDNQQPPQGNDGQQPPEWKDGQQPPFNDNNGGKAPKTQTKKITITDESIIKVQNGDSTTAGSLKDIKKGSMIYITYKKSKGKKVMSSITVSTGFKPNNNNKTNNSSNSTQ